MTRSVRMSIYESDWEYSEWNDSQVFKEDLLITISSVQFYGGGLSDGDAGFGLKLIYAIEHNQKEVFSYEGLKQYTFPINYASIHLLSFLSENSIREFHDHVSQKKTETRLASARFEPRKLTDIFDDLIEALAVIRLQEAPKR